MHRIASILTLAIALAMALAPTQTAAEANIRLKANLTQIVVSLDDSVVADLIMVDRIATWSGDLTKARSDTSATFLGFATYEVLANLIAEGVPFARQKNLLGRVTLGNTRGVFLVTIMEGKGEAIPVAFSAFGIGMTAPDGSRWHTGVLVISRDQNEWELWPTDGWEPRNGG